MQLENVSLRNGVLLLRPSNVSWIGGDVESFRLKFDAAVRSRDNDQRIFQSNLKKNETPPPQFEDADPTGYRKRKKVRPQDRYKEEDYAHHRVYDEAITTNELIRYHLIGGTPSNLQTERFQIIFSLRSTDGDPMMTTNAFSSNLADSMSLRLWRKRRCFV